MNAQTVIPRLRVGAGKPDGSDGMCAMQVVSWENGDTQIVDMPACADLVLARIVQGVNDRICTHATTNGLPVPPKGLLCPACSVQVLELAHRTVGTGGAPDLDRQRVWVRVAADQARQVLHLAGNRSVALAAIEAAERWAEDPTERNRRAAAAYDAAAAAAASSSSAAYAASAAYDAAASAAYDAAASAAVLSSSAAYAYAVASAERLRLAHRAIDVFLTHTQPATPQPTTEPAMAVRSAPERINPDWARRLREQPATAPGDSDQNWDEAVR